MANYIQFTAQHCQKYASHKKKVQIKVVQNWISYKKVSMCICLSPQSGARGSKDGHVWSIIMQGTGKLHLI